MEQIQADIERFSHIWLNDEPTLWVQTSGSTGTPKPMLVEKKRMEASARLTCEFLGLKEGDTALLCLPLKYISGQMMMVRSWVYKLDLLAVPPSGHPLATVQQAPDFAAMTPMQVYNSLQVSRERELLKQIRSLIIGGGAVDGLLAETLADFPHAVWSTYGMTETLSHVALRRINGATRSDWYTPMKGVEVRLSVEGTLCIDAPHVCAGELVTNDIAELNAQGQFRILGRKDNVINSGGVKIQIEQVEGLLRDKFPFPFLITSAPHPKYGEEVVLLVETDPDHVIGWQEYCKSLLPAYWCPKRVVTVDYLPLTETGKPDRTAAKQLALLK